MTSWAMIIIQEMIELTTRQPNSVLNAVEHSFLLDNEKDKDEIHGFNVPA